MPFHPNVGDRLVIDDVAYTIGEHPFAPGMPYGQEGRAATVYMLEAEEERRALKAFKMRFRLPWLVGVADQLEPFATMPGLTVCKRQVLTALRNPDILAEHADLNYAVVMPWVSGPTWMEVILEKRELTAEQSLMLGRAFASILARMEERRLAHCDLSGPNVILPALPWGDGRWTMGDHGAQQAPREPRSPIELVDLEGMYGPGLDKPEVLTTSSAGYAAHHTASRGVWEPKADRFAGAILLAEMLGWCDERVRQASYEESYFEPQEVQKQSEQYSILHTVLEERWGRRVAGLLDRAWKSDTLSDCPTFGDWLASLPREVPAYTPAPKVVEVESVPLPDAKPSEVVAGVGTGAAGDDLDALMDAARESIDRGDLGSAIAIYKQAQGVVSPGSGLAGELALIVQQLEEELQAQSGAATAPATVAETVEIKVAPARPTDSEDEDELASLFYGSLAALKGRRWAEAKELLTEVLRRQPGYERDGKRASKMLAEAEAQLTGKTAPVPPKMVEPDGAPSPSAPAIVPMVSQPQPSTEATTQVNVQARSKKSLMGVAVPAVAIVLLVIFGAIAVMLAQGGNKGQTPAGITELPQVTPSSLVAQVDTKATQAAGTATASLQEEASAANANATATTLAAVTRQAALAEASVTAEALAQIAQLQATTTAEAQVQGTVQAMQAQATADTQAMAAQQATTQALSALQAEGTALVLNATITAQAESIAATKAVNQANSQATIQVQNANRQATAQAQGTAQALQVQINKTATALGQAAAAQEKSQATAAAQQTAQAFQQAQQSQATSQALIQEHQAQTAQAQNQQATAQAQQAAVQATAQAQQAQAQQATAQAQQTAQAEAQRAAATAAARDTAEAASAGSVATAEAIYAQATAQAQATASAYEALGRTGTHIYGPENGSLVHNPSDNYIVSEAAGVDLKNFVVECRFYNPYAHSVKGWDYGFGFRDVGYDEQFRLEILSRGIWELGIGTTIKPGGAISNLDTSAGGSNLIRLVVQDSGGAFYINGQFVALLDLRESQNIGDIFIATGFKGGNEMAGASTRYEGFTIWSLP